MAHLSEHTQVFAESTAASSPSDTSDVCGKDSPDPGVSPATIGAPVSPPMAGLSCAALAYLGDSVLELMARQTLICRGLNQAGHLNREARNFVCAPVQARAMRRILPYLQQEEDGVYRRGRNNIHANTPKNATVTEYRSATGMECLFAYLHLTGRQDRAWELFRIGYDVQDI